MTQLSSWDQWLALRRCHHHHLSNPRMSEHGGLSSKVKCQMLSIPTHREGPGAPSGAWRPCLSAGDGKNTITGLVLLWSAVDVNCLLILYLTEGGMYKFKLSYSIQLWREILFPHSIIEMVYWQ